MQMLGNFEAKRNFIILYFLIPSLGKNRFCTTEGALFKVQLPTEYVLKQEFILKYALNYIIFIKNCKNRPALEALPPDPLCLRRLGATPPDPTLALARNEFLAARLIIAAAFT